MARTPPRKRGQAQSRARGGTKAKGREPLPGVPLELEKKLLGLLKQGLAQRQAAAACGIPPETLRNWVRKGVEGDARYKDFATAAAEGVALHHLRIAKAGVEDWRASAFLLERIARAQYGYKADIGVTAYLEKAREALLSEVEQFFGVEAAERFADHLARKWGPGEEGEEGGEGSGD